MFVSDYMTTSLITVTEETPVLEAIELLKKHKIRQLPVTSGYKKVGLVTERELLAASPSPATTLSVYEIKDLMSKLVIKKVMIKNPLTVTPYCSIEEAALIMRESKNSSLLVEEKNALVGIITESDIFEALIEMSGMRKAGTRIVIEANNKIGLIAEITGIVRDLRINVVGIGLVEKSEERARIMLRLGTTEPEQVLSALKQQGYKVSQPAACSLL